MQSTAQPDQAASAAPLGEVAALWRQAVLGNAHARTLLLRRIMRHQTAPERLIAVRPIQIATTHRSSDRRAA